MAQKVSWHQNVDINLGRHGKIAHLLAGEKLKLHSSTSPNAAYESFANMLLREIARSVGVMFEDLTGDYRQATYSSMRAGIAKLWPLTMYRRRAIPGAFSTPIAEAWIEEEVDRGSLEIPGGIDAFVQYRGAICAMDWRGPPRPVIDEVKTARMHEIYKKMGVMSDKQICADLNSDRDDVYRDRFIEAAARDELGLDAGEMAGGSALDNLEDPADAPAGTGAPANDE